MPNSESEDDVQDLDDADFDDVFAEEDGEDELLVSIENAADDATEGDPVRLACSASPRSARSQIYCSRSRTRTTRTMATTLKRRTRSLSTITHARLPLR